LLCEPCVWGFNPLIWGGSLEKFLGVYLGAGTIFGEIINTFSREAFVNGP